MARVGLYQDAPKPPCVVGYEFAGEVESVGEGVEGFDAGSASWAAAASAARRSCVVRGADALVPLPDDWSYEEGAALPVVYATAYAGAHPLRRAARRRARADPRGGGRRRHRGHADRASWSGAEIFGTASRRKHDAIRGFGVDHPIDYRTQDFVKEVRRITGEKQPLDLVMDAIGGRASARASRCCAPAGGWCASARRRCRRREAQQTAGRCEMLATDAALPPDAADARARRP